MSRHQKLLIPLLAGAAGLGVTVPVSSASAAAKPCDVSSANPVGTARNYRETIYESPDVNVIEHVVSKLVNGEPDIETLTYRACSKGNGRQTQIYEGSPGTGPGPNYGFDARGNWLVYGHFIGSGEIPASGGSVRSLDARSGRRGPVVNQIAGVVAGGDGLLPDVGQAYTQLAIASDGEYAWVSDVPATAGNPTSTTTGLFAPAAPDGDRAIDAEPPSAITDLTVHGQRITWVVGGQTKSAVLP